MVWPHCGDLAPCPPWAAGGGSPPPSAAVRPAVRTPAAKEHPDETQPACPTAAVSLTARLSRGFKPAKALGGLRVSCCLPHSSSPTLSTLLPAFPAATFLQFLFPMLLQPPCPCLENALSPGDSPCNPLHSPGVCGYYLNLVSYKIPGMWHFDSSQSPFPSV